MTLPDEFAPTGPKLTRFALRPPPPLKPRLMADEARFALRLCMLAGLTELAAWAWLISSSKWIALGAGVLRLSRFGWARLGTRLPRPAIAFALLFVALAAQGAVLVAGPAIAALACALCSLGDLCGTMLADTITVERRPAAFAWLDIAQAIGVALGVALGLGMPLFAPAIAAVSLLVSSVGVLDLRDRGTPRSSWPAAVLRCAFDAPIGKQLVITALLIGALGVGACSRAHGWIAFGIPMLGMGLSARLEPWTTNAVALPRALVLVGILGLLVSFTPYRPLAPAFALLALGGAATALPASITRAAAELLRAPTSSLVWSALSLGAGLGAALLH